MPAGRLIALPVLLLPLLLIACGNDAAVEGVLVARSPTPGEAGAEASPADAASSPTPTPTPSPTPETATPNADGVFIVPCGDIEAPLDKLHRLEADCEPAGLVAIPEAYAHGLQRVTGATLPDLLALLEAASAERRRLAVVSSYRSFETQRATFQYHVDELGLEQASRVSARPGHSEHQLGTTVDFSSGAVGFELVEAFGETPEGRWLAEHAHEFGFIMSYPQGQEQVTGYSYEPWHFRWVGRELAAQARASGLTLGQFLLR